MPDLFQTSAEDHVSCQAEGISGLLAVLYRFVSCFQLPWEPMSNGFNSSYSRWTNKSNPTEAYQVNPPGPKFQRCTKLYSFLCVTVWLFCPPAPSTAQRQHWNLGMRGRQQYSRGLISSSIYGRKSPRKHTVFQSSLIPRVGQGIVESCFLESLSFLGTSMRQRLHNIF